MANENLCIFFGLRFMLLLNAQFEILSRSPCKDDAVQGVKTSDKLRSSNTSSDWSAALIVVRNHLSWWQIEWGHALFPVVRLHGPEATWRSHDLVWQPAGDNHLETYKSILWGTHGRRDERVWRPKWYGLRGRRPYWNPRNGHEDILWAARDWRASYGAYHRKDRFTLSLPFHMKLNMI